MSKIPITIRGADGWDDVERTMRQRLVVAEYCNQLSIYSDILGA